jgi:hypothetical protein
MPRKPKKPVTGYIKVQYQSLYRDAVVLQEGIRQTNAVSEQNSHLVGYRGDQFFDATPLQTGSYWYQTYGPSTGDWVSTVDDAPSITSGYLTLINRNLYQTITITNGTKPSPLPKVKLPTVDESDKVYAFEEV